jgi:hypothetical protein
MKYVVIIDYEDMEEVMWKTPPNATKSAVPKGSRTACDDVAYKRLYVLQNNP